MDKSKETRGYCKLKEEALYSAVWKTHLRRSYGLVVRQDKE